MMCSVIVFHRMSFARVVASKILLILKTFFSESERGLANFVQHPVMVTWPEDTGPTPSSLKPSQRLGL